ncbi:7,8 dihydropteroate synthase (methanopterin) [Methanosarcina sp. WWM596]|nr:7,8 dihydropteroate synthase (methanopterin) [Methanosarcina sp. WWM596]AKB22090.1 7,8 dihydropteroate synthase (methanopterin) [Methanosarcina sp. WH1]
MGIRIIFLGLVELLKFVSKEQNKEVPFFLHPDTFLERCFNISLIGHTVMFCYFFIFVFLICYATFDFWVYF